LLAAVAVPGAGALPVLLAAVAVPGADALPFLLAAVAVPGADALPFLLAAVAVPGADALPLFLSVAGSSGFTTSDEPEGEGDGEEHAAPSESSADRRAIRLGANGARIVFMRDPYGASARLPTFLLYPLWSGQPSPWYAARP
jgi:hypothetical protein